MATAPRSVTIGVRDLDESVALFHGHMDLTMEASGSIPADVLNAWGLPDGAMAEYALLSRDGYAAGQIRLVQWRGASEQIVRDDLRPGGLDSPFDIGPKAIDQYIPADMPSAVAALEKQGYPLINGPIDYEFSGLIEAMHSGPDGLSMLLMTRPTGPNSDMRDGLPPNTYGEVATISVISASPQASEKFYGDLLQIPQTLNREASPRLATAVARLNGLPDDTRVHWQMYVEEGQESAKMILVHYPDGEIGTPKCRRLRARMQPGHIGICLYSFERSDVNAVVTRARQLGFTTVRAPADTSWGRLALVRGPNEELIELMEG